jgi:hypothetical protein
MSLTYHVYIPQNLTKARFLTRKMSIIRFCSSSLDTHSSSMSVFVAYCHYRGREHATSLPFFLTHIFLSTQTQDAKNFFPHASATTSISTNAPFLASAPICHPATMSARRPSIGRSQRAEGETYLHTSTYWIRRAHPLCPDRIDFAKLLDVDDVYPPPHDFFQT